MVVQWYQWYHSTVTSQQEGCEFDPWALGPFLQCAGSSRVSLGSPWALPTSSHSPELQLYFSLVPGGSGFKNISGQIPINAKPVAIFASPVIHAGRCCFKSWTSSLTYIVGNAAKQLYPPSPVLKLAFWASQISCLMTWEKALQKRHDEKVFHFTKWVKSNPDDDTFNFWILDIWLHNTFPFCSRVLLRVETQWQSCLVASVSVYSI